MAVLTNQWSADIATLFLASFAIVYLYFKSVYRHWEALGLPYLPPTFPFGNFADVFLFRKPVCDVYCDIYRRLDGHQLGGFFQLHKPTLLVRDLDLVKAILVKDFASFQDRGVYHDEENDPISNNLFLMGGHKWRTLRAKLTPTFTSGKMKMMFHTLLQCGVELETCMLPLAAAGATVEVQDVLARYTTDVIASCAFGIECNCLKNPDAEFRSKGRQIFKRDLKGHLGIFMLFFAPALAAFTKWGNTPEAVSRFFIDAVRETVEYREKNNVSRNDFMQLLIRLKNLGYVDVDDADSDAEKETESDTGRLDMNDVAAQAFIFFVAGFETSSATMAFCLYELAVNPDWQRRLRREIDAVLGRHGGTLTYDGMQSMELLDRVIAETLRKYPPLAGLYRICNTAYPLAGSGVVIEPGTLLVVPVYAIHQDPRYYPEPARFDPDRFTKEAKAQRNPYAYMPFGEGPRNCIGMRFGLMQTKVGLVSLLRKYAFEVAADTAVPLVLDPKMFLTCSKGGIRLRVVSRS